MAPPNVYKNYIDGEWVPSVSGHTFHSPNPANTQELVGIFQKSNQRDVDNAIQAAKEAYKTWRVMPPPKRGEILYRVARLLVERKELYAENMTREMVGPGGNPRRRSGSQSRYDVLHGMRAACFWGRPPLLSCLTSSACGCAALIGICSLVTPWNFPMAIPSWKIMPALICGNTAVIKPATDTPLSTYNLVQTLAEAGIPRGVVNLVTGTGADVGTPLMVHEDVRVVSFTGSTEVGKRVAEACAGAPSKIAASKWAARTSSW